MDINLREYIEPSAQQEVSFGLYENDDMSASAREMLNTPLYTLAETDASYRTINHWSTIGLLNEARESQKEWRKFTLTDLVWIGIISQLRNFGFSLDKIHVLKEGLFYRNDNKKRRLKHSVLELYILYALTNRTSQLVVFESGKGYLATDAEYNHSKSIYNPRSHIVINLNDIVSRLVERKDSRLVADYAVGLSSEELYLLYLIRDSSYQEIRVTYESGKMRKFEGTQSISNFDTIATVLHEHKYQNITLVREGGKVRRIKRVRKELFT